MNPSRSVRAYIFLVLTSQVQARLSTLANSKSSVDVQEVFKSAFTALINEDDSIGADIDRYQSVLERALSKVDFLVDADFYMRSSNLNLKKGKTAEYDNKTLVSNTDMRTGSKKNINKFEVYHQKSRLPAALLKFSMIKVAAHTDPEMYLMNN